MKKLAFAILVFSSPAFAQTSSPPSEPVCEPIGRTSKGDLVYSMQCRKFPACRREKSCRDIIRRRRTWLCRQSQRRNRRRANRDPSRGQQCLP